MLIDVGRRKFITLLSGTMVMWPLAAHAQQAGAVRRVGVLMNNKPTDPEYARFDRRVVVGKFNRGIAGDPDNSHRVLAGIRSGRAGLGAEPGASRR
jgi:hypothetical protein